MERIGFNSRNGNAVPHRHKVVIIAEQTTGTEQNTDCITFEECLAMTEPDSYGSTE